MAAVSPKYAFAIAGNPNTTADKCKALAAAGPLILAKEHVLPVWLPEAFTEVTGSTDKFATSMRDVIGSMVLGGMGFAREVLDTAVAACPRQHRRMAARHQGVA